MHSVRRGGDQQTVVQQCNACIMLRQSVYICAAAPILEMIVCPIGFPWRWPSDLRVRISAGIWLQI